MNYPQRQVASSPVVIDMASYLAFIKLHSRFFLFHRFQERQRLTFAHLTFFFRFGLRNLGIFIGRVLRFLSRCAFHFSSEFLSRRFRRSSRRARIVIFASSFSWRG